ncbi:YdcF family protein [Methylopila sp. 73B]|uniref:YdcF family protein n=1 Tax=Methylopila sp. 73B TaxID=1120792 RepID=UPI00036C6F8E|nr:YdcF family protein [Methylopila sp. 73B]
MIWAERATAALVVAAACAACALTAAGYVLPTADAPGPADVIVVLGGFGPPRAERAARLFADGGARRILVAGAGDCDAIRDMLIARGAPAGAVDTECASRSTLGNARRAVPLLAGARSVILVTHWYHQRRALACFRANAPSIAFAGASVRRELPRWRLGWTGEPGAVLAEYAKIAWYALRYGIVAWTDPVGAKP